MIIGLDIDGVLRDFSGSVRRVYKRDYPDHVIKPQIGWDLADCFPIGEKIYEYVFKEKCSEILVGADPYEGAVEFVKELEKFGHRISIISHQHRGIELYTLLWLTIHGIPYHDVHFTKNKASVLADVYLDDNVENLQHLLANMRLAVCFDRPWNQEWSGRRVYDYAEFLEFLKQDGELKNARGY